MKMKAFIFDVDKVVMNFSDQQALSWREALRHFCQDVPLQSIRRKLSEQGTASLSTFFLANRLNQYGQAFINHVALVYKDKYQPRVQVRPQMYELFEELRASGLKVGLISIAGKPELSGNRRLAQLETLLQTRTRFAVSESVQSLMDVLSDTLIMHEIDDPSDVIMVCATPSLAQAARALNMRVIGLVSSDFSEAELGAAGCHEVYETPAALLQLVERSPWSGPLSRSQQRHQPQENRATLQHLRPLTIKS